VRDCARDTYEPYLHPATHHIDLGTPA